MNLRELQERRKAASEELGPLVKISDATKEQLARADALIDEIKGIDKKIDRLAEVAALEARGREPVESDDQNHGAADESSEGETRTRVETGVDHRTEEPWQSLGHQLQAVRNAVSPGQFVDPRLLSEVRAATGLGSSVPADGGFLVGTDFSTELLRRVYETGVLTSRARRMPISGTANSTKINGIDETSRANGSRWGGVQAFWTDEAAEKTKSKPKFRQMELTLSKLTALIYATDEVLADAAQLQTVVNEAFPEEIGFKVDDAFVRGDGSGKPQGVLNGTALVTVAKESGQAAKTFVSQNVYKMYARMWSRSMSNSAWFINQDVWPQIFQLVQTVGTGGVPMFIPAGGISAPPFGTLMGRPIVPIEQASTLGTVGDILFADWSQYMYADKGGIETASSIHVRFIFDESVFRFTYRIDGQPIWNSPLTPFKGTATQSPFIVLATRS